MTLRRKSPGLVVLLSLIPGLGHVYAGEAGKGLLLFLATGVAGFLMVIFPGVQVMLDPSGPNSITTGAFMIAAITTPLYFLVLGPALVIYSMASSHRLVVDNNAAIDAANRGTQVIQTVAVPDTPRGWTLAPRQAMFWGAVLTVLGLLLVLPAAAPGLLGSALRLWPLLLVVLGVATIAGATERRTIGRDTK